MGETAADTAREVELTRRAFEDKFAVLAQRAPDEARRLAVRAAVVAGVATAVLVVFALAIRIARR